MPSGANITKAMNIDPKMSGQRSVTCDSSCSRNTKNTAAEDRANQRPGPAHDHHDEDAARNPARRTTRVTQSQQKRRTARRQARRIRRPVPRSQSCRRAYCSRAQWSWLRSRGYRRAPRRTGSARWHGTKRYEPRQATQHEIVVPGLALEPGDAKRPGRARDADDAVRIRSVTSRKRNNMA